MPRPRLQVAFTDGRGRSARVDMLFDRVVGEADGAGKYDEPGALFAEKQREDWLRDVHRLEVVRWVPAEMRSAGKVRRQSRVRWRLFCACPERRHEWRTRLCCRPPATYQK